LNHEGHEDHEEKDRLKATREAGSPDGITIETNGGSWRAKIS